MSKRKLVKCGLCGQVILLRKSYKSEIRIKKKVWTGFFIREWITVIEDMNICRECLDKIRQAE